MAISLLSLGSSTRPLQSTLSTTITPPSARVLVAVDGVASLVAASRDEPVLRLVDALRADPRVAAVLLFHRGAAAPVGTPGNQDGTPRDDNGTLAASALRRAASCYVDVASVPASTTNRASSAENPTTPDATLTSTLSSATDVPAPGGGMRCVAPVSRGLLASPLLASEAQRADLAIHLSPRGVLWMRRRRQCVCDATGQQARLCAPLGRH